MNKECSCEELLDLINSLIDGELEGETLTYVQSLIQANPKCQAMFQTVSKTIDLYRMRRQEIDDIVSPEIDWSKLEKQARVKKTQKM